MPTVRHRLDLLLVPVAVEQPLERAAWDRLMVDWAQREIVLNESPGVRARDLISGGFRRLWLDEPGGIHLFANHQGGYRVHCPGCGVLVTGAFVPALANWRAGGERQLECPSCGQVTSLEHLTYRPEAAFARWAVVLSSVTAIDVEREARMEIERVLGPLRIVLRRVG